MNLERDMFTTGIQGLEWQDLNIVSTCSDARRRR